MRRIASLVAGSLVHAADNGANGPLPPVGTGPLPNVWGGRAFGNVGGVSGHLFAFSGADGATQEGSGFVGVLGRALYDIVFDGGGATLHCGFGSGSPDGTLLAASSDALVVAASSSSDATPGVVVAYSSWDLLLGRAPEVSLRQTSVTGAVTGGGDDRRSSAPCNLTGCWHVGTLCSKR